MCFVRARLHGLRTMACAVVESVKIGVVHCRGNPSSPRKLRRKMASVPASLAGMYFDSGVKRATVKIVYDFQETAASLIKNT